VGIGGRGNDQIGVSKLPFDAPTDFRNAVLSPV